MTNKQIHETRKQINILKNTFGSVVTVDNYRHVANDFAQKEQVAHPLLADAMKLLQYSSYWLGKLLNFNGEPAKTEEQYAKDGRDDTTTDSLPLLETPTENLVLLRAEIQKLIDTVDTPPSDKDVKTTKNQARAITNIWQYLHEVRFCVGELIGELREKPKKEETKVEEVKSEEGEQKNA